MRKTYFLRIIFIVSVLAYTSLFLKTCKGSMEPFKIQNEEVPE